MIYLLFISVCLVLGRVIALTISIDPFETTDIVIVGVDYPTTTSANVYPISSPPSGTSEVTQSSKYTTYSMPTSTSGILTLSISSATPSKTSSLVFSYRKSMSVGNSTTGFIVTGTGSPILPSNQCVCVNNVTIPPLTANVTEDKNEWTGPDWSYYPTSVPPLLLPAGPQPTARPYTIPAVAQLIQTTQDYLINEYNLYGVISCFLQGATTQCSGPWLYGKSWNNSTLNTFVVPSTVSDSSYECSSDQTYLSDNRRVFYGFSQSNITTLLGGIAHSASLYAASACLYNSSCTLTYQNDTAQMYNDFRGYINSTFFATLTSLLPQNESLVYCPGSVSGSASLLTIPTTAFDGGLEYFGLHNAIFIPGMTEIINGTIEQGKKELGGILANNARKVEGTFLNMVFFSYESSSLLKRSQEDEVYPNCTRKDWVINGCKGVVPPREYDLAGTILPMKDRDRMESLSRHRNHTTDLMVRDTQCESIKNNIEDSVNLFLGGKALLDLTAVELAALPAIVAAALGAEVLGASALVAYGIASLGGVALGVLMTVAACEAYNTCSGLNPALVAAADAAFGNQEAALGLDSLIALVSRAAAVLAANPAAGEAALTVAAATAAGLEGAAVAVLTSVIYIGLQMGKAYLDKLLDAAANNYENALACCGNDCASAVCQQAGSMCLNNWSPFWSGGSIGTNCAVT